MRHPDLLYMKNNIDQYISSILSYPHQTILGIKIIS